MKSIMQEDDRCYVCKMAMGAETHHVFGGPDRKYSDKDGLTVRVCRECHCEAHKGGKVAADLHEAGQKAWEAYYGPGIKVIGMDPRRAFMERYRKNYL